MKKAKHPDELKRFVDPGIPGGDETENPPPPAGEETESGAEAQEKNTNPVF